MAESAQIPGDVPGLVGAEQGIDGAVEYWVRPTALKKTRRQSGNCRLVQAG